VGNVGPKSRLTFGLDPELGGRLYAAGRAGSQALVHARVTAHQAQDL
jgi:hypothetical protein